MKWQRREVLGGMAGLPAALAMSSQASVRDKVFKHGVASGDPTHDSVVIWTRVTTDQNEIAVTLEVAADERFKQMISTSRVRTNATRDFTVKRIIEGLRPGEVYFYRFKTNDAVSITGRTRTLPVGATDKIGLALASCSNYVFGFFNAYDAIADDKDVQFVLHTGDYIYEYGADSWGSETAKALNRVHSPAGEIITLSDYRTRHAQYKSDRGSIRMHAAHPLLCLWDDHESTNNPWHGGAQNHQPDEGPWEDRRSASLQAYYEWMPIREPHTGRSRAEFWRHYRFGDLASLVTIESRHTGRDLQIDYNEWTSRINSRADAEKFQREVLAEPGRRMLSDDMTDFLLESLEESISEGRRWRILGNAIPMAKIKVPDVASEGIEMPDKGSVPGVRADVVWKGKFNLPFYLDTWDGYWWAREELYRQCREIGATDLLVLSGDSHSFWANELYTDEGNAMGVEIGTAGISSPGDFVETGFSLADAKRLDELFIEGVPSVRWTSNMYQGYVRLVIRPESTSVDYIAVSTLLKPVYETEVIHSETVHRWQESLGFA